MAVWDDENYIHIVDRKKDIIISGGENISSIEVEKAILRASGGDGMRRGRRAGPEMGRGAGGGRRAQARAAAGPRSSYCAFLGGRIAGFKMPRMVEFADGASAENRHRKNTETPVARGVLGGKQVRVGQA